MSCDIEVLKADVVELKRNVSGLNGEVASIKQELHRQGVVQEHMRDDLRLVVEALSPLLQNSAEMHEFHQTLGDQGDQIKLTQSALKDHVRNRSIHLSKD